MTSKGLKFNFELDRTIDILFSAVISLRNSIPAAKSWSPGTINLSLSSAKDLAKAFAVNLSEVSTTFG